MAQTSSHQLPETINEITTFKEIFNDHKKSVFAVALSILRDNALAEDVLQEVYIKLFEHMKQHEISNVKGWLVSVARNTALDVYRKKKREITGFETNYFDSLQLFSEDPLEKIVLSKYMELLSSEERQIVTLKDITGMKHREIAKIVEMPLGTVLWKYRAALKKLRKALE